MTIDTLCGENMFEALWGEWLGTCLLTSGSHLVSVTYMDGNTQIDARVGGNLEGKLDVLVVGRWYLQGIDGFWRHM